MVGPSSVPAGSSKLYTLLPPPPLHPQVVFSMLVYTSRPSSHLPILLVPTIFAQLGLLSTMEHPPAAFVPPVLALVVGLLYTTAFTFLPWTMSYPFR